MRKYVDFKINREILATLNGSKLALELRLSGFQVVVLSCPPNVALQKLKKNILSLTDHGLDVATRVDISPTNRAELLKFLQKYRRRFDIIGVKNVSSNVSVISARDRRVDTIYYDLTNRRLSFTESIAHICTSALEILIQPLLYVSPKKDLHRIFQRLHREVTIASKHNIPIILSSSATNIMEIRAARDIAAFAQCLGLKMIDSLNTVSTYPMEIIDRNRFKLSGHYIMDGVAVHKEDK